MVPWSIIDHHDDNDMTTQLRADRSAQLLDTDGQIHSSWQINHPDNETNNHTPATRNKCQIYNCFPGLLENVMHYSQCDE